MFFQLFVVELGDYNRSVERKLDCDGGGEYADITDFNAFAGNFCCFTGVQEGLFAGFVTEHGIERTCYTVGNSL